jgi:DNA replication protein DnaC
MYAKVQDWQHGARGLFLTGKTGVGKTRAIWELLKRLYVDDEIRFLWHDAQTLGNTLEQGIEIGRGALMDELGRLKNVPVLFLDDFGQGNMIGSRQDWFKSQVLSIVDARLAKQKPTFVTTNLTARNIEGNDDLSASPLVRRLVEGCEVLQF